MKAFSIQCWNELNSTISTNHHSPLGTIRIKAPAGNEPELANAQKGKRTRGNPEIGYFNIILKYNNKVLLLKSSKYTMQLQYVHSEEGLTPWEGANTLRMLQFLELAHLQVRPHAPGGKARPQVPEKFLLPYSYSTKCFGNYPGCPAPFGRNIPYIGYDLVPPN